MKIKNGLYRHYKGNLYQVIGVAKHSENDEVFVIYQALYGNYDLFVRPYTMFKESIQLDDKIVPRFEFIDEL